ncbi:hypothetical protein [Kineococcus esterisolvens]|uniref:hypothetical protein n=1 Tax=unclassified Kineococcus TaxID=2621656 RepID=UPI003D7E5285
MDAVKPLYRVLQDLEHASRRGRLTPSFIDEYADKYGERVSALYALAAKNFLTIAHEDGRNDHVLRDPAERQRGVNAVVVASAMEDNAREMHRELRKARDDGRPYALRKPGKNAFFVRKPND